MKRNKLEGNTYGHLYVKEYIGNGKYHCICSCKKECDVFGSNLIMGHTTSCGHIKHTADLTGNIYGCLKVLERSEGRMRGKTKRVCWRCICLNCGKISDIYSDSLTSGHSCECARKGKGMPDVIKEDFISGTQKSKIKSNPTKSNKSGVVGVNWDKSRDKWQASIRFKGHKYSLGRYSNFEEACRVRKEAEIKYFGPVLEQYRKGEHEND